MARYGRGDLDGAVADWEQALALRPNDERATEYLAFVRRHQSSLAEKFRSLRDTAEFRKHDLPLGVEMPAPEGAVKDDDPYDEVELGTEAQEEAPAPDDLDEAESPPSEPYAQLTLELGDVEALLDGAADADGGAADADGTPVVEGRSAESDAPSRRDRPSVDDGWDDLGAAEAPRFERVRPAARAGRQRDMSEEATVPGGDVPPPLPDGVFLSQDVLAALKARGETGAGGDTGEERTGPGIVGEVELGDLSRLESGSFRDDRVLADEREAGRGEPALRARGQEDLDEALTAELPRGKLASTAEAGDDELTLERRAFDVPGARGADRAPAREDADIDGDATNELWRVPVRSDLVLEAAAQASMTELAAAVLAELDRDVPEEESEPDRIRRRVTRIIRRAEAESEAGRHRVAIAALELALEERPDSPIAQKVIHRHRDLLLDIYQRYFGDMTAVPVLAVPMQQLSARKLDHRTAFLVTRVDGTLSFDEILDVAGMTRFEACRHLARLLFEGILMVAGTGSSPRHPR